MPYIKKELREGLDQPIKTLSNIIISKGELNYVICELVGQLILRYHLSYENITKWISAVNDAKYELNRRILDPYENTKIEENDDLMSFIKILKSIEENPK